MMLLSLLDFDFDFDFGPEDVVVCCASSSIIDA
jgi:hypothetical protein